MNMMKLAAAALLGLATLGATGAVLAHGVNARQFNQQARVHHGIVQGDLTRRETLALLQQQRDLARTESRMRRDDGVLGAAERARLEAQQDRASHAIRQQRHDAQRR